jgi:hypothetical protein
MHLPSTARSLHVCAATSAVLYRTAVSSRRQAVVRSLTVERSGWGCWCRQRRDRSLIFMLIFCALFSRIFFARPFSSWLFPMARLLAEQRHLLATSRRPRCGPQRAGSCDETSRSNHCLPVHRPQLIKLLRGIGSVYSHTRIGAGSHRLPPHVLDSARSDEAAAPSQRLTTGSCRRGSQERAVQTRSTGKNSIRRA